MCPDFFRVELYLMFIMHSFFSPSWKWYYPLRWLLLILLGLAIYAQTFGFGFVFDDLIFVVNNPYIKNFDHIQYIWKTFPNTRTIGFYSFAFNYLVNQLHPQGYHIFNFLIHLLAVGLVWACARKLFKIVGLSEKEGPFFVALLFLVHPSQTQAVTYISQRFESMATVFYLGSIYFYICARTASSNIWKIILFSFCTFFAILGILTKEVAASIPVMILATEWIFFTKKRSFGKTGIVLTVGAILFFLLFMKLARTDLSIFLNSHPIASESHDGDMITVRGYLLTQMRVFLTFMRLFILPTSQNVDYDYPLSTGLLGPPLTLAGLCLIGAFVFLIFKSRHKYPLIAFGLAWILITFSINLAPRANVIFEHKLYLMSFGALLAAVNVLFLIFHNKRILTGILIGMVVLLSVTSFIRNQVWKSQLTLWEDTVQKSPGKARPYNSRGLANFYQGNLAQAMFDYNNAIAIKPNFAKAYVNRGILYYNQGDVMKAMSDYNKAIGIDPENSESYNNRGILYYAQGRLTEALFDYKKAIALNPFNDEAYFNLGNLDDEKGDSTGAFLDYSKAIEINPNVAGPYYNRGLAFAKQGYNIQAILDFTKAIGIEPYNADVYINRGMIFAKQSDFVNAISDYNKAIEINSGYADAYYQRGICYFQQGDFTQAISDYNKAISLNPNYAQVYYNRAIIYFQLKEYDRAREDVLKVQSLGIKIDGQFLKELKKVTGKS